MIVSSPTFGIVCATPTVPATPPTVYALTVRSSPSTSLSTPSPVLSVITFPLTGTSCDVVDSLSVATGASLTGSTRMLIVAVAVRPSGSAMV